MPLFFNPKPALGIAFYTSALLLAIAARAEPVMELKCDRPPVGGVLDLDLAGGKGAPQLKLSENAEYKEEDTGLGDEWPAFLKSGFVYPGRGTPSNGVSAVGVATSFKPSSDGATSFRNYMGYQGMGGKDSEQGLQGGTLYLVLSPGEWKPDTRYGLFGTGHSIDGQVLLTAFQDRGVTLLAGGSKEGKASVRVEHLMEPEKWYLVAASWAGGEVPHVYLREMAPEGAEKSPPAQTATGENPVPPTTGPEYDPIVIGASWHNPGSEARTLEGADARIAYVRLENTYSTVEQMAAEFQKLAEGK